MKIGTEAIEELLCLPPNEEPPQDLASIISDSFCDNDMNSGLAYLCDVDSDGLVHFNIDRSCMFDINSIQLDLLNMGTNEKQNFILK